MKKILVGLLALTSMTAFAQRHMVTVAGWENSASADMERSLDLNRSHGGGNGNSLTNIALNYAFAVTNAVQVGALYKSWDQENNNKNEIDAKTMGVFAIYNFAGRLTDTNYLTLGYSQSTREDKTAGTKSSDTDINTWSVEFGHRFSLGTIWNMNVNWSPSVELGLASVDENSFGSEYSSTTWNLNVLKFDVLF